ncbi:MAG: DNA repair protein RecO [Acidobacteriota bacterium]
MQWLSAEALILDVRDLGERDRLITWLTREHGLVRGAARGARGKHSRFAGQLQPLAKVSASWTDKESWQLARLSSAELIASADFLHRELEDLLLGEYLAEQCVQFSVENEVGVLPYRLLDSTLEALRQGVDRDLAARFFEVWMLRIAGVFPQLETCAACSEPLTAAAAVLVVEEGLFCRRCAPSPLPVGAMELSREAVTFLEASTKVRLRELALSPPPRQALRLVERACAQIRRTFLQYELRSYQVMKKTLQGLPQDP